MNTVEFVERVADLKLLYFQKKYLTKLFNEEIKDDKCQECKKDWTKCAKCPVMMKWIKEHKEEHFANPTGEEE